MKTLIITTLISIASFNSLAADSICYALKEGVPYSSRITYSGKCDGAEQFASSGLFGNDQVALDKFKQELRKQGYPWSVSFLDNGVVVYSKKDLKNSKLCLANIRSRNAGFTLECDRNYTMTIKDKTEAGLMNFARQQRLKFIQKLERNLYLFGE